MVKKNLLGISFLSCLILLALTACSGSRVESGPLTVTESSCRVDHDSVRSGSCLFKIERISETSNLLYGIRFDVHDSNGPLATGLRVYCMNFPGIRDFDARHGDWNAKRDASTVNNPEMGSSPSSKVWAENISIDYQSETDC